MNIRATISIVVCLCFCLGFSQAQEKNGSVWDQAKTKSSQSDQKEKDDSGPKLTGIPMEGPIDPTQYVVGPFDIFALTFWGVPPMEYTIAVTPEGTLLIPTVGEVRVADATLAVAKKRVAEAVEKKYLRGAVSMTLVRPRSLIVTLRGAVSRPGQYIASAIERVEKIILQAASNVSTPNTTFSIPALTPSGLPVFQDDYRVPRISAKSELDEQTSVRNIRLIRRSGDTLRVDIPKYYATLDNRYNPFLVDGDLIVVPSKTLSTNFVSVHGAVNSPGRYEFVQGDSLVGILQIAQGTLETADRHSVTIYRSDRVTEKGTELIVDLDAVLNKTAPDLALQRGDRVLVPHQADRRRDFYVTVAGEVNSPGDYPITRQGTKLSQIIKGAGGLSNRAFPSGSVLWRKDEKYTIPDVAQLEYLTFLRAHQFDLVDSTYFFLDLKVGRQPVVVNFKQLLLENDTTCDVTLRHGDFLYIASNERSVLVQGQVSNPGYLAFVPGADYKYYIKKAGDYQQYADEGEVRIIKEGTTSWFKPGDTTIEPGDRVWVPKEVKRNFWAYFGIVRDVVSVVISVATLIYISRK
ncbi:MAG: SLBB domain-containing protein [Ignavibacteriales bacterium]|nr:SLBB domain-containing protein [Ignavibacteriales bacterium]